MVKMRNPHVYNELVWPCSTVSSPKNDWKKRSVSNESTYGFGVRTREIRYWLLSEVPGELTLGEGVIWSQLLLSDRRLLTDKHIRSVFDVYI